MNLAIVWLLNLGSGRISRAATTRRLGILIPNNMTLQDDPAVCTSVMYTTLAYYTSLELQIYEEFKQAKR